MIADKPQGRKSRLLPRFPPVFAADWTVEVRIVEKAEIIQDNIWIDPFSTEIGEGADNLGGAAWNTSHFVFRPSNILAK